MYDPHSPLLQAGRTGPAALAPEARARFAEARLLNAVIWCEVAPGETVSEAEAMERFGLTRAAARAGLARLGHDGWAMPQARAGWRILPVTGALIGQVLAARRIAEPALADVTLTAQVRTELQQIAAVLAPLDRRPEIGAAASRRRYLERIDALLLSALDPFTARHLRGLWHHTERITRYLEDAASGETFDRVDGSGLLEAVLAGDSPAIRAARAALVDAQEAFFLRRLLHSDTPLIPGGGTTGPTDHAAINWRET